MRICVAIAIPFFKRYQSFLGWKDGCRLGGKYATMERHMHYFT